MAELAPYRPLVEDFSPGFIDTLVNNRLPGGAVPDGRNAWFHDVSLDPRRATMGRRPGDRLVNPTSMSLTDRVDGLFEYRRLNLAPDLLAGCNGQIFKFDGVNTFVAQTAVIWTAGNPLRGTPHRESLILVDGTAMRRWNGAGVFTLGEVAPTSAPGLATVAGPGVSGTYESYAVWYDPAMEHESSPSAVSAPVVFANQQRRHTKPTGAPGAQYTFWRVYVRRTDTNEINFYRAAEVAIGTATFDEATSDTARREAGVGPLAHDHDPPSVQFAALVEWKGYGIGFPLNSDSIHVSKRGDLLSWHPKHVFPIARSSGRPLVSVHLYGEDVLLQKDTGTWRLVGDTLPFTPRQIHSSFGNVSQEAALEVDNLFYAWDRVQGPYSTDTVNWRPLARGRIKRFLKALTSTALDKIRAEHYADERLIVWTVPVNASPRTKVLLAYQYELDAWLPPITGLEYAALAQWTDPTTGVRNIYAGDERGRVHQLFTGARQSVPTTNPMSTLTGLATAATGNTLTDAGASFYTTGDGLAGLPVAVRSPAGVWQWRRILSNTGTVLTLDTVNDAPWLPVPAAGWRYLVGGIEWHQWTPWLDGFDPFTDKLVDHVFVQARSSAATVELTVDVRQNGEAAVADQLAFTFPAGAGMVWGESLWGEAVWGAAAQRPAKREVKRTVDSLQLRFSNYEPDASLVLAAFAVTTEGQQRRRAPGA